jgi:hypothetical protein
MNRSFTCFYSDSAEGAGVAVKHLKKVVYCLTGTDSKRVTKLVAEARATLALLQKYDAQKLSEELRLKHTKIVHSRLAMFTVVG